MHSHFTSICYCECNYVICTSVPNLPLYRILNQTDFSHISRILDQPLFPANLFTGATKPLNHLSESSMWTLHLALADTWFSHPVLIARSVSYLINYWVSVCHIYLANHFTQLQKCHMYNYMPKPIIIWQFLWPDWEPCQYFFHPTDTACLLQVH